MFRPLRILLPVILVLAGHRPAQARHAGNHRTARSQSGHQRCRTWAFFPWTVPSNSIPVITPSKASFPVTSIYEHELRLLGDNDWQRLAVRLVPYSRKTAWSSNILFAGLGQHYLGKSTRGYIYNAAEAGGLLVALFAELERSNPARTISTSWTSTTRPSMPTTSPATAKPPTRPTATWRTRKDLRNTALMVAAGAIVVSILDAIIFFPSVEGGAGPVPLDTGSLERGTLERIPNPLTAASRRGAIGVLMERSQPTMKLRRILTIALVLALGVPTLFSLLPGCESTPAEPEYNNPFDPLGPDAGDPLKLTATRPTTPPST